MKNKHFLVIILLAVFKLLSAQSNEKYTISGYVSDTLSGEKLIGTTVFIKDKNTGTTSNLYGFYSITLPKGEYEVLFSYVGYNGKSLRVNLKENIKLNVDLSSSTFLEEVVVSATRSRKIHKQTLMSVNTISMQDVEMLPALMGEKDLVKTLQLLPGVQSGSEGSSGLYVRGGGPDQNLILLDGVPIYNASHLFGFFSVFNSDAINNVTLTKGGFPARYGGRLSSVIDVRMKEGNLNDYKANLSIGLISSKFSFEGPIFKDKTSFIVSGRRTYIDYLMRPFIKNEADGNVFGYYFYDINAKINHKFSDKSRLFVSLYNGQDKMYSEFTDSYNDGFNDLKDKSEASIDWGNTITAVRWNYVFNPKLFSNITFTYSKYGFKMNNKFLEQYYEENKLKTQTFDSRFDSKIDDLTLKFDLDYIPSPNHYIKFGFGNIYHTFSPGAFQSKIIDGSGTNNYNYGANKLYGNEYYAYFEDDIKVTSYLKVNAGLHFSGLKVKDKNYISLQPRIATNLKLTETSSFKASYSKMNQFLHLLTNPTIGLPTDLWVPSTDKVKPEYSNQYAAGYAQTLFDKFEISIEGYYKTMENLIEYSDGTSFFGADKGWENKIETGKGESYGLEILLEKKTGKTTGLIGYTLSWSNREFDKINFGKEYPYKYDRRHDISFTLMHKFNKTWDIGLVWVYGTGNTFSLGMERYNAYNPFNTYNKNEEVEYIKHRNNYRMPSYHRLDVGINHHKVRKKYTRTWSLSVYNVYNRKNPFFLSVDKQDGGKSKLKQFSLFPILPSITYSIKF